MHAKHTMMKIGREMPFGQLVKAVKGKVKKRKMKRNA